MDKLKKDVALVAVSLAAMSADVKAITEDQRRMADDLVQFAARGRVMDEQLLSLNGTFATIG